MLKQAKRKVDFRSRETRPLINRGETMRHPFLRLLQSLPFAALAFQFGSTAAIAQEKKMAQVNGVDNSKMGPYRALAQHVYGDFQKGDVAGAAAMGRVLERLWDKAEDYGDRKSTRLNSSHDQISYAVFCLKKKKNDNVEMAIEEDTKRKKSNHHLTVRHYTTLRSIRYLQKYI